MKAIKNNYLEIMKGQHSTESFDGQTLFIKGVDSDYIISEYKEYLLSLFPKAELKIIIGAGHWLHAEKPNLVARCIKQFLEELRIKNFS